MEKITIKDINVLISMLKDLKYGSVFITWDDYSVEEHLKTYMNLVALVKGSDGFLTLTEAVESVLEGDEYVDRLLPGWYRLTWADRHEATPVFTYDEMNLRGLAEQAATEGISITLQVRPELVSYAKKLAKEYDVKFMASGLGIAFNGKKRAASAYKQLEAAVMEEKDSVEFDSSDVNPQTIRVYVSQISGFTGRKMRVSVKGNKIVVFLKEPGPKDLFIADLKAVVNRYSVLLTTDEIKTAIVEALGIESMAFPVSVGINVAPGGLTRTEAPGIPMWQQMEFESEEKYNKYLEDKEKDLADWAGSGPDKLPSGVELVDGLPQYVMEELKNGTPAVASVTGTPPVMLENGTPLIPLEDEDF